jgi:hypothetical protein
MSNNSEILIIRHMRRVVPRQEVFPFTRKKSSSMKQADLMDNRCGISYPVSYSINFFSYEDSRKHRRGPW